MCRGLIDLTRLLLPDGQCSLEKRLSKVIFAHLMIEQRQVVEANRYFSVFSSVNLFANCQCPDEQRFCLGIHALIEVETGQVVEAFRDIRVCRPKSFFANPQSLAE